MQEMFEQTNQTEEVQMEEAQEQEFEQSFHAQEEDTSGADTQEIMNEAFALNVKYNGWSRRFPKMKPEFLHRRA